MMAVLIVSDLMSDYDYVGEHGTALTLIEFIESECCPKQPMKFHRKFRGCTRQQLKLLTNNFNCHAVLAERKESFLGQNKSRDCWCW